MSNPTYTGVTAPEKPLVWLGALIKTPPFTKAGRVEVGYFLRRLQRGKALRMPHSRPMPAIGPSCHELRITDETARWRVIYRVDAEAIVVVDVFKKQTRKTPKNIIETCRRRLRGYDHE